MWFKTGEKMKKIIVLLPFILFGCYVDVEKEETKVNVRYFNGSIETLVLSDDAKYHYGLSDGCLCKSLNSGIFFKCSGASIRCGVKSIKIISKTKQP